MNGSFLLREVDGARVKGRKQMISIYELIAKSGASLPMDMEQVLEWHAIGLKAYCKQCWEEALDYFKKTQAIWPKDATSRAMVQRCQAYRESPPQGEWDGVFQQTTK